MDKNKGKYFGQKPDFFPIPEFSTPYFFPIFCGADINYSASLESTSILRQICGAANQISGAGVGAGAAKFRKILYSQVQEQEPKTVGKMPYLLLLMKQRNKSNIFTPPCNHWQTDKFQHIVKIYNGEYPEDVLVR